MENPRKNGAKGLFGPKGSSSPEEPSASESAMGSFFVTVILTTAGPNLCTIALKSGSTAPGRDAPSTDVTAGPPAPTAPVRGTRVFFLRPPGHCAVVTETSPTLDSSMMGAPDPAVTTAGGCPDTACACWPSMEAFPRSLLAVKAA